MTRLRIPTALYLIVLIGPFLIGCAHRFNDRVDARRAADAAKAVLRLIDALDDLDDVQDVYANFDVPDEILVALEG